MSEQPVWHGYPVVGTPEAGAAAAGMENEQPMWHGFASIEPTPEVENTPATGLDLYRQAADAANRALSMGLSDKIGAATLATGHALGAKSPYDVAGPSDSWLEAYHKNLDALRQEGEKFSETNPTASKVATTAGSVGSVVALPSRGLAAAGLLPKIGEGAKLGAEAGGIAGFGGSKDESVPSDLAAIGTGAAVGAGIGAAGSAVADRVASPFIGWLTRKFGPNAAENQAVQAIAKRMTQDANAGGPKAQDMIDLDSARAAASAPAYKAAGIPSDPKLYPAAPVVDSPAVTRLLDKSKDVKSAIAQAKGLPDYVQLTIGCLAKAEH
jgi:hypothetical protein